MGDKGGGGEFPGMYKGLNTHLTELTEGVENAQKTADAAGVLATQNQTDIAELKGRIKKYTFVKEALTIAPNSLQQIQFTYSIPSDETLLNLFTITNEYRVIAFPQYEGTNTGNYVVLKNLSSENVQCAPTLIIATYKQL